MQDFALSVEQLHSIPALRDLTEPQLERLIALFQRMDAEQRDVLFEQGERPEACYLLAAGEVTLHQDGGQTQALRPPVLIGELGAVTGLVDRTTKAVAGAGVELWRVNSAALRAFLDQNSDIALCLLQAMLATAADKICRDHTRIADMRRNLIRTQKAMKQMRDFLLESQDTVVSKPLHEMLEGLIRQNRRANYRVEPPPTLSAHLRMDDGTEAPVVQISRTHVSFSVANGEHPPAGTRISGVLQLCGPEIPVSGKVLRTIKSRVDLELDLLIDEYVSSLEGYLTRVQMLDTLV